MKRAYEDAQAQDGVRVLVDRLWPRGITRDRAEIDLWLKDVTPSPDLRRWWNHDLEKFQEFEERYRLELEADPATAALDELCDLARKEPVVTLVYGAKDPEINHVVILREVLLQSLSRK